MLTKFTLSSALPPYRSPDEIADLVKVHTNTVNRWLRKGVKFSDGSWRRPEAIRTPGGWRGCGAVR